METASDSHDASHSLSQCAPVASQSFCGSAHCRPPTTPALLKRRKLATDGRHSPIQKLVTPSNTQSSLEETENDAEESPGPRGETHEEPSSSSSAAEAATTLSPACILWKEAQYNSTAANNKRQDYISWDEYFMAVAVLSSMRSKDPHRPTGACIVDSEHRIIIGTGYNGFPVHASDDVLPWRTNQGNAASTLPWLHTKEPYQVHAEVNAILNKCAADCRGATLYTQHFPCHDCAKVIAQAGIAKVVYMHQCNQQHEDADADADSLRASRIIFALAGVQVQCYKHNSQPSRSIVLNFTAALSPPDQDNDSTNTPPPSHTPTISASKPLFPEHQRQIVLQESGYDPTATPSGKRHGALSWDDYFMAMAFLTAQRSKDPNTQVGACIVDQHQRIIGLGYNGFPKGCSDDHLPWARHADDPLHTKYMYVCHAEVNAILNKGAANVRGATLYVALFPCNECAKFIIQAGISKVVYMNDMYHDTDSCRASRILFQMAGVQLQKHVPAIPSIEIQLDESGKCPK